MLFSPHPDAPSLGKSFMMHGRWWKYKIQSAIASVIAKRGIEIPWIEMSSCHLTNPAPDPFLSQMFFSISNLFTFSATQITGRRNISSRKVIDDIKNKPVWLEDPSTYPVIVCTVFACIFGTGYFTYIQTCKNYIRWSPSKRCSEIRWWGDDKADLRMSK